MTVALPYGETTMPADLPDDTVMLSTVESAPLPPVDDLDGAVRSALAAPLGLPRIGALVKPGAKVTIAFDDHTTGSFGPIRKVAIQAILDELEAAGVGRRDVTLICANALHRMLRPAELARLLGDELVAEFGAALVCHDAEDPAQIVDLGITNDHGYPVEVNRLVAESDLTVYVNTNYIRGFTGGWKSVCVGLSTWRTIRVTHTPDGMSMSVDRNRMHAVLDEMGHHLETRLRRRIFKIDTLLSDPYRAGRIFAGAVDDTRRAALAAQASLYPPRRQASPLRFDVILYGVPDSSPYAIYASVNPILTLVSSGLGYLGGMIEAVGKPGCTVIMAAPARDQWDPIAHPSYRDVWERVLPETRDPYDIMARFAEPFAQHPEHIDAYRHRFAFHPIHGILATHPLKRLRHVGRVIVAAPLHAHVPRHLGFEVAESVEEAIAHARHEHGRNAAIAYVAHPPLTR